MKGLAPHTLQIFEAVSQLDCIKPYLLVGGTALSLQIGEDGGSLVSDRERTSYDWRDSA